MKTWLFVFHLLHCIESSRSGIFKTWIVSILKCNLFYFRTCTLLHVMCDSISNDQGEQRIYTHTGCHVYEKIVQLLSRGIQRNPYSLYWKQFYFISVNSYIFWHFDNISTYSTYVFYQADHTGWTWPNMTEHCRLSGCAQTRLTNAKHMIIYISISFIFCYIPLGCCRKRPNT